jgi:hypothetical protein
MLYQLSYPARLATFQVPQSYKLQGYNPHNIHNASSGYVARGLARTLRTGADDEVIYLSKTAATAATSSSMKTSDMPITDSTIAELMQV